MSYGQHDYLRLNMVRDRLVRLPQAPEREVEIARLTWEIQRLDAEQKALIAKRALLLFDAYQKIGSMAILNDYTGQRMNGQPYLDVDSPVQRVWNVRTEAERLAAWSVMTPTPVNGGTVK